MNASVITQRPNCRMEYAGDLSVKPLEPLLQMMLSNLAMATWGYSLVDRHENYTVCQSSWHWYARQRSDAQGTNQYFCLWVNVDETGRLTCITIEHAAGYTKSRDVSEEAIGWALKLASKAGPALS
jgi:hypothetical protein